MAGVKIHNVDVICREADLPPEHRDVYPLFVSVSNQIVAVGFKKHAYLSSNIQTMRPFKNCHAFVLTSVFLYVVSHWASWI